MASPKAKRVVSAHAIHGGLAEGHKATMYDLGDAIPQVPLAWFQENMLAPLPSALGDLSGVIDELKRRERFCPPGNPDEKDADNSRKSRAFDDKEHLVWKSFHTQPSFRHGIDSVEDKVFKPIESLATEVGEAAEAIIPAALGATQLVKFRCNPSMTLMSTLRVSSTRPDSYGIYTKHPSYNHRLLSEKVCWELVIAPGEFKKKSDADSRNDNVRKIMWSLNHIMREDVRRRFVVGYTIEDTDMRLWFCSRTDVFVAESFNFMTDHRNLAHFFLSLMYASESQLGYDTTICYPREVSLFGKQWDIDVHVLVPNPKEEETNSKRKGKGRARKAERNNSDDDCGSGRAEGNGEGQGTWRVETYRTLKSLSNIGAEAIRGRGTRVWEVSKLGVTADGRVEPLAGEKPVVLKDSWIDDDRKREAVTREQILRSAPPDLEPILANHLLTGECYGDVAFDSSGSDTRDTTAQMRGGRPVPKDSYFTLEIAKVIVNDSTKLPTGSDRQSTSKLTPPLRIVEFDDKCHHRTVFKEVGRPLDTLNSVFEIVSALAHAVIALGLIHHCGWVHRDISAGNILIVPSEDGNVVKIADLEYAKRVSDKTHYTMRTGTIQYMAVEVEHQNYLFLPATKRTSAVKVATKPSFLEIVASYKAKDLEGTGTSDTAHTIDEGKAASYPFHHNPLHDIESVWWLAIRLTLVRLIAAQFLQHKDQYWKLPEASALAEQETFFTSVFYDRAARYTVLQSETSFVAGQKVVHPKLLRLYNSLDDIRQELKSAYLAAEKDVSTINHTVGEDISSSFFNELRQLAKYYKGLNDLEFEPIDGPVKKTTPEEHAALPPGLSLDSRLPKRLREDLGSSLGSMPSSDAEDVDFSEYVRAAKRVKRDDLKAQAPVAGLLTIPVAASVEVELPPAESSENVGCGKGKLKEKGKDTAKANFPTTTRRRTQAAPAGPLRRSTRVRKTTQPHA